MKKKEEKRTENKEIFTQWLKNIIFLWGSATYSVFMYIYLVGLWYYSTVAVENERHTQE